jgi:predicted DNA-binding transcriptional regulator AlpA
VNQTPSTPSPSASPTIEKPLTAAELAEIVPYHQVTILRMARERRIPHRRLSPRKVVFLPSEIQKWLSEGSNLYPVDAGHAASTLERKAA